MGLEQYEVSVEQLRRQCDPSIFDFESTGELARLGEFIGQDRAASAVAFGLNMQGDGYNIYASGLTGTGKTTMVKTYIEKLIAERESRGESFSPDDYCYVYNFKEPDRPQIINLPQGKGKVLRSDIDVLLASVKEDLQRAFSSEEYKGQKQKTMEEGQSAQQHVFEDIAEEARQQGFALKMSPMGPALIPMVNGKPMEEKQYLALKENAKKDMESRHDELLKKLQAGIERAAETQRHTAERLHKLDKDVGEFTVSKSFTSLHNTYAEHPVIGRFLDDLKSYTLDNIDIFKGEEEPVHPLLGVPVSQAATGKNPFLPFRINVFVDNSDTKGPPVIIESNPNFANLFGMIERRFIFGGYISDHTMIKPGALSMASGGYLLLRARDAVLNYIVWPALKRAIKNREVRIEEPYEQFGLLAPQGMKPEPMPIDVKIVLIGESHVYRALSRYDEDFWEIFRVKAEFDDEIDRNEKNMKDYAAFISSCCDECGTRQFAPDGVSFIIEHSSRMVSDQERLSSRFAQIKQLIQEADYWASHDNAEVITGKHIRKAIDERVFRHNLVDERIRDMIKRGFIMIDLDGTAVGQINGLSLFSLGDIAFGRPSRITANTFIGRDGVINIERESQLSGPIHDKGVMILGGYMGWKYAQDKQLSLSASLCFEQSYQGVDGDSASSAELYAILSSLSEVPLRQGIAVTGSVNQKGEIQPIGGVNHKIEGFFRVCRAMGLSGNQGVLIPDRNLRNLMLHEDVVEAVRKGEFHIYAAKTVDEGIEILTGVPAGERQDDGTYPEGTVNYLVNRKLTAMSEKIKPPSAEDKNGRSAS